MAKEDFSPIYLVGVTDPNHKEDHPHKTHFDQDPLLNKDHNNLDLSQTILDRLHHKRPSDALNLGLNLGLHQYQFQGLSQNLKQLFSQTT